MQDTLNKIQTLMVQGTTSDAGKSALVTALCRYFYRKNYKVTPFKPQNMALNSAVTIDGGEIGRAQAVQAIAAGLDAHTDMNPVLLKPNSDKTAQVIIHGKASENLSAKQYHAFKKKAMEAVLESHKRLSELYQLIVVEGAGSPAEINLRTGDLANMGFAEAVDCPVILIADIDKGGVFAHIVGTLELLSSTERQRVIGFVINRFRGDMALLQPGIDWLENKTGKPVFAVLPYLHDLYLEAEDSVAVDKYQNNDSNYFNVVIPRLPRISNHTDFDPLLLHPGVNVQFIKNPADCSSADLVILPGSKSVRDDLTWINNMGWDTYINKHLRYGGRLLGICGGYQMLGSVINDVEGIEGQPGTSQGLGLLDMETSLKAVKTLKKVSGTLTFKKVAVAGYEIHAGISQGRSLNNPMMLLDGSADGAVSSDKLVMGTYLHGLFDLPEACNALLSWAGFELNDTAIDISHQREAGINLIADTLEQYLDFKVLERELCDFVEK